MTGLLLASAAFLAVAGSIVVATMRIGFAPVLSPSMEPTFAPGDLVVTRAEPTARIHIGQVLALPVPDAPGQRYVHRVIAVQRQHGQPVVRTKGDANPAPDRQALRVTSTAVPVVVASVPRLGQVALLAKGSVLRTAMIAFIGVCGLITVKRLLLER